MQRAGLGLCIAGLSNAPPALRSLEAALTAGHRVFRTGGSARQGAGEAALARLLKSRGLSVGSQNVEVSSRVTMEATRVPLDVRMAAERFGGKVSRVWIDSPELRLLELQDAEAFQKELDGIFTQLEGLADEGLIEGYEVASTLFSTGADPSGNGAQEIRLDRMLQGEWPRLTGLQVPLNALEVWGLEVAKMAAARGLRVGAVRPHLAVLPSGIWSLTGGGAEARPPPADYQAKSAAVLERFSFRVEDEATASEEERDVAEGCRWLRQLVNDMHRKLQFFTSPQHYEQEFLTTLMPLINDKFDGIDEESLELLMAFFKAYSHMVEHYAAQRTRQLLTKGSLRVVADGQDEQSSGEAEVTCPSGPHAIDASEALENYSLRWARAQEHVDLVFADLATAPGKDWTAETLAQL